MDMEQIKKQQIANALKQYCERYESQNKAAVAIGVSSATVSQIINGNWDLIKDEMWRTVASAIGFKSEKWEAVQTTDFGMMTQILSDAKENALVMAITGDAGSGKTFACRQFADSNKQVYLLCCNEFWNRKTFLQELCSAIGINANGMTSSDMVYNIVSRLKKQSSPLIILDEADKLTDQLLYFFITLYNQLEDECGIVLTATDYLEKRLQKGIRLQKKGYNEIWSRIGRKCVKLRGVSAADVVKICEANGITNSKDIDSVIDDCDSDLRRVRRKIFAITKKNQTK